jgi:hypothetical protein
MCCCGKPNINGTPSAYSWDGQRWMTYKPNPPDLLDGDTLLYDEPGRCGGIDAHSHHFRLVKAASYGHAILVRHGGGDERIHLGCVGSLLVPSLASLDSNGRYWFMHTVYSTLRDGQRSTEDAVALRWRTAAAEKRIKTQKRRGRNAVRVWIEPAATVAEAA